jgi:DNA polymerase-1
MKDKQIGIPEVIEKWGVPPEKMIDLQALTGDSVDNVPGVPGIGPKTAAQLLEQFGDLDALLARASEIKQDKRRQSIIDNADKARISRELVRLKIDVPVTDALEDFVLQPPNGPKLIGFLKTMEFTSLTRRVAEATGTEAGEIEAAPVSVQWGADAHGPDVGSGAAPATASTAAPAARANGGNAAAAVASSAPADGAGNGLDTPSALANKIAAAAAAQKFDHAAYVTIRDLATLKAWVAEATEAGVMAFDTETNSLDPMQAELVGISFATAPGRAAYVPLAHKSGRGDLLGGGLVENQIPVRDAMRV